MLTESVEEIAAWMPDEETKSFVYFLRSDTNGSIKIGCSICPPKRRAAIKSETQADVSTIKIIRGSRITESYLHYKLRPFRIAGEWFRPEPELFRLIDMLTPVVASAVDAAQNDYRQQRRDYAKRSSASVSVKNQ